MLHFDKYNNVMRNLFKSAQTILELFQMKLSKVRKKLFHHRKSESAFMDIFSLYVVYTSNYFGRTPISIPI